MTDKAAKDKLRTLLRQVFEDGVLDEGEREQLTALYRAGGLTVAEVKVVVGEFVQETWGETIADGVISADERAKLKAIVTELRLPRPMIPDVVAKAIGE